MFWRTRRIARRASAQGRADTFEGVVQQHHVGLELRGFGTAAHGEGHVGAREHRRVVEAVADHRHHAPFVLQALQVAVLVLRAHRAGAVARSTGRARARPPLPGGRRSRGARARPSALSRATSAAAAGRSVSSSSNAASQPFSSARNTNEPSKFGCAGPAGGTPHSSWQNASVPMRTRRPWIVASTPCPGALRGAATSQRAVRRRRRAPPDAGSTASSERASAKRRAFVDPGKADDLPDAQASGGERAGLVEHHVGRRARARRARARASAARRAREARRSRA